jgi:capsid assembly protease
MTRELLAFLENSSRLWAIDGDEAAVLAYMNAARQHDGTMIEAKAPGSFMNTAGNVAVINVHGPISHKANIFTAFFGGAAVTALQSMFRQAMADDSVKAVVFSFDTPGGTVSGIPEFAAEIRAARGQKPIIGVVDSMAASAGYWLAAATDQIVAMPSGLVGSIGVITLHVDSSQAIEKDGHKVTVISAGKYKAEGMPTAPLSEEAQAAVQSRVNEAYAMFVDAVADGRGVKAADVRNGYGEGRIVSAKQGKSLSMIDRIGTLEDVVGGLVGKTTRVGGLRAELAASQGELAAQLVSADADRRRRLERF